ncbi:hypothetical protein ACKQTC_03120 [Peptococcus simiae]|uniref:Phage protein n=1 Tax=Peptococcus simiae TaxID=1643805 RepID=A0ABW9GXL8_9FIRM
MLYLVEVDKTGNSLQLAVVDGKPEDFTNRPEWVVFNDYDSAQAVLGKRLVDGEWQEVLQEPPAPPKPEPQPMEKDLLAIMDGVAATYERQEKGNLDIMEGIAGLYEATMTGGNPK